jgi:DNA ligase-1
LGQPKLDGIRCIAIKKGGVCTLWSRTRKPILSVPHIAAAVEALIGGDLVLDGELYNHDYRNDFEEIISLVRPDEPVKGHEVVQYHIYDTINGDTNTQRARFLSSLFNNASSLSPFNSGSTLQLVPTREIASASDVEPFYEEMRELGYEGAMMRNADGLYVPKRSYDLLKHKGVSQDAEYKIADFEEGKGRLQGHIGAFWCVTPEGKRFKAKLKGKTAKLKEYFKNHALWEGKILTVQYQNLTAEGKPRFPIGLRIRDYE